MRTTETVRLTPEQEACVDYIGKRNKDLVIKGSAGSGKSLAIQRRAVKYIRTEKKEGDCHKAALFTFNQTLAAYSREMVENTLNSKGLQNDGYLVISTLSSYLYRLYFKIPGRRYVKILQNNRFDNTLRYKIVKKIQGNHIQTSQNRRFLQMEPKQLLAEFDWIRSKDLSVDEMAKYHDIVREGRKVMPIPKDQRDFVFRLYQEYENELSRQNKCEWGDLYLFISHHAMLIPDEYKFDHVLIDEAQDQSLCMMRCAAALKRVDITIAMDSNQRIYSQHWRQVDLGISATTKTLSKSFRCTKEIEALAESLRKHNDPYLAPDEAGTRQIPESSGPLPQVIQCSSIINEKQKIIDITKAVLQADARATVGILCRTNSQAQKIAGWCTDANIPHEILSRDMEYKIISYGAKISTVYSAKGLEFGAVIIPSFEEGVFPISLIDNIKDEDAKQEELVKERNLIYVALTRAFKYLFLTFSGKSSRFLSEMDPMLYEYKGSDPVCTPLPPIPPIPVDHEEKSMLEYVSGLGYEVIDKRDKGGAFWIIGNRIELADLVINLRKKYHATGNYTDSGRVTGYRMAWYTKCSR